MKRQLTSGVFYTVFFLLFIAGGVIANLGIVPFRPVYACLPIALLVPFYGIKFDSRALAFFGLSAVIIISGLVNDSSLEEIALFFRYVLISYSMYYLVNVYVNENNLTKITNLVFTLGMWQLPLVVFQRFSYDWVSRFFAVTVIPVDFNVGTFYVDSTTGPFLIGLILILLFDKSNTYHIKNRNLKIVWYTATVFLTNSFISQLMLIGIFGFYLFRVFTLKTIVRFSLAALGVMTVFFLLGWTDDWIAWVSSAIGQATLSERGSFETFSQGGYSRSAAVLYYLEQPLSFLGDGPSRYYDPVAQSYEVGNRGQLFTFYSEVGIFGLIAGYWVLYSIASKRFISLTRMEFIFFLVTVGLTATTNVLSGADKMLAYCLLLKIQSGIQPDESLQESRQEYRLRKNFHRQAYSAL
ncbi:MAG: hypothetical protein L0Y80_06590 [Ignavibacteriae bacterium]|nr:hypothetical protein [Ignavibacteriota bacterium]